ncbi:MAG: YceI family protein [Sphingomonadales bacterium]|nr:YceI family protein [Sphingomonadales bacterium]
MPVSHKGVSVTLAAAVLALAAPLAAQIENMAKPGARDASRITGGTYRADSNHSMVGWRVDHMGLTPYFGMFGDVTGLLELDPKNPAAAKVEVSIPVARITTASAGLTEHLLSGPKQPGGKPDFFGPKPDDAHFRSTSVMPDVAAGKARMTGDLTLNGITRPVTLDVEFYGAAHLPKELGGGEQVGFEARGTLKRSDFGLGMGVPLVSDEVQLDIVAAFAK